MFQLNVPDGKTSQQVMESAQKKLDFVGAQKVSSWNIDCEAFQSLPLSAESAITVMYVMHNSEYPFLTFNLIEGSTCMVAHSSFDLLMAKLKAFYVPRKGGKTELKGTKYEYGDFTVKVGSVTQASNFKGIIIEVHYLPCFDVNGCWNLINEFATMVIDRTIILPTIPSSLIDVKLDRFSEADTMNQYLQCINSMKKS